LWSLRNEETARESAFQTGYIDYNAHKEWFANKLQSKDAHIFIVLNKRKRVGQVRLDVKKDKAAEIDIGILKDERGKGLGAHALKLLAIYGLNDLGLREIIAYVKSKNTRSLKAFEKADFINEGSIDKKGTKAYRMVLR